MKIIKLIFSIGIMFSALFVLTSCEEEKAKSIYEQVEESLSFKDGQSISNDITLPTSALGATITWSSSDESTISTSGKVNRPDFVTGDISVTLTANITFDGKTESITVNLIVLKDGNATEAEVFASVEQNMTEITFTGGNTVNSTFNVNDEFNKYVISGYTAFWGDTNSPYATLDSSNGVLTLTSLPSYESTDNFVNFTLTIFGLTSNTHQVDVKVWLPKAGPTDDQILNEKIAEFKNTNNDFTILPDVVGFSYPAGLSAVWTISDTDIVIDDSGVFTTFNAPEYFESVNTISVDSVTFSYGTATDVVETDVELSLIPKEMPEVKSSDAIINRDMSLGEKTLTIGKIYDYNYNSVDDLITFKVSNTGTALFLGSSRSVEVNTNSTELFNNFGISNPEINPFNSDRMYFIYGTLDDKDSDSVVEFTDLLNFELVDDIDFINANYDTFADDHTQWFGGYLTSVECTDDNRCEVINSPDVEVIINKYKLTDSEYESGQDEAKLIISFAEYRGYFEKDGIPYNAYIAVKGEKSDSVEHSGSEFKLNHVSDVINVENASLGHKLLSYEQLETVNDGANVSTAGFVYSISGNTYNLYLEGAREVKVTYSGTEVIEVGDYMVVEGSISKTDTTINSIVATDAYRAMDSAEFADSESRGRDLMLSHANVFGCIDEFYETTNNITIRFSPVTEFSSYGTGSFMEYQYSISISSREIVFDSVSGLETGDCIVVSGFKYIRTISIIGGVTKIDDLNSYDKTSGTNTYGAVGLEFADLTNISDIANRKTVITISGTVSGYSGGDFTLTSDDLVNNGFSSGINVKDINSSQFSANPIANGDEIYLNGIFVDDGAGSYYFTNKNSVRYGKAQLDADNLFNSFDPLTDNYVYVITGTVTSNAFVTNGDYKEFDLGSNTKYNISTTLMGSDVLNSKNIILFVDARTSDHVVISYIIL